jgi:hypothetical protein
MQILNRNPLEGAISPNNTRKGEEEECGDIRAMPYPTINNRSILHPQGIRRPVECPPSPRHLRNRQEEFRKCRIVQQMVSFGAFHNSPSFFINFGLHFPNNQSKLQK